MKVISGGFQNSDGTPVAFGRMYLTLTQDAAAIGGPSVAGGSTVSFKLDANGQLPSNAEIWYNDELTPAGTAYQVSVVAAGGGLLYGPEYFIFAGTSPSNVGGMFPSIFGGSVPVFSTAILANPVAPQTIAAQPLSVPGGLTGTPLTNVNNGNTVTLINAQHPNTPVVGTGAFATLVTVTIPGGQMGAGKGVRIHYTYAHATGSASVSYQITYAGLTLGSWSSSTANRNHVTVTIINNPGLTNSQHTVCDPLIDGTTVVALGSLPGAGISGTSLDSTVSQTVLFQFSVANTDQVTPFNSWTELLQ